MSDKAGLFDAIRLGPRTAKNRIMRVATTANLADNNRAGPRVLAFYQMLARGGVGTMVTEALRTQPDDPFGPGALVIFDRTALDSLRALADVCHAEGALLIGQLNMGGRQHLASRVIPFSIAPSAIACPRSGGVPHELSDLEIEDTIETFVTCAVHCIEAGMDGVEIHGAQGHLIQQFLSPFSNRRTDDWGGSFDKRMRFAREILTRVRQRVGTRAVVGYRMGVEEFTVGGLTIDDTLRVAETLSADGLVDYLSLAQGNFNSIETHLPDRHSPILVYRSLHRRFKAIAHGVPVVASTRIQHPDQVSQLVADGEVDMIGLCRALLADPDWPKKAQRGQADSIRRCMACNQCWAWIGNGEPIACATNPVTGREHRWRRLETDRAALAHSIVVVGGGPAGLEAARVAAARGHDVQLWERSDRLGGRLKRIHEVPHFEEVGNVLDYLIPQTQASGAAIRYGERATVATVLAANPDDVVIAVGATPYAPDIPGDGTVPVVTTDDHLPFADLSGRTVVVMDDDGYYWTAAVTESVIAAGARPIVVSRVFEVCREVPMVSRIEYLRQLDRHDGKAIANTYVSRIRAGNVLLRNYLTERETVVQDVAAVVWVGAAKPKGSLAADLRRAGMEKHRIHVVGDAFAPRRLFHALTEAHAAARSIGSAAQQ
ncbi:MAG: FAD-dependent oxidoreductase [Hyphomicrobiaceae bacterium]